MHEIINEPMTAMVGRPTWLEIDLDAIVHNFRLAKTTVGDRVDVYPVVKADGYGLGAEPIALALQKAGATGFCVALLEEAEALQAVGIIKPIILLSGLGFGLESRVMDMGLQPFVYSAEQVLRLLRLLPLAKPAQPITVHLKIDTGMGRLGVSPQSVRPLIEQLSRVPGLHLAGVATHLACADEAERSETARQVQQMQELLSSIAIPMRVSMANSAGILAHPKTHGDWVRPGIMLYGASPFFPQTTWERHGLRPVVQWLSQVIQIRTMAAGQSIGYGHTFTTTRPSRIAQVPVGYGDGFSRSLGNRGWALVAGQRVPIVGRVCMDSIALDVTALPQLQVGDRVTLLGRDGTEFIGIEEMAAWVETIPYEVLCRLGRRLRRVYYHGT